MAYSSSRATNFFVVLGPNFYLIPLYGCVLIIYVCPMRHDYIFRFPILWLAEYKYVEYIDGSSVAVCLTQALSEWTVAYFLMTISVFFMLPLILLVILYGVIAKNLISSKGPMMLRIRPTKPELSHKARKQVVFMLGAVVLSFFLCLLPFRMLTLWIILSSEHTVLSIGFERYYTLLYFCRIMLYLNSAINPLLYNLMSTKFRKGFLRLGCSFWNCLLNALTLGRHGQHACNTRREGRGVAGNAIITNTNTTTSSNNIAHNTSSSMLSRSSNRRTTKTQPQHATSANVNNVGEVTTILQCSNNMLPLKADQVVFESMMARRVLQKFKQKKTKVPLTEVGQLEETQKMMVTVEQNNKQFICAAAISEEEPVT